jgi:hypothetical protein
MIDDCVRAFQQFRRNNHNRGGSVPNLFVLQMGKLDQALGSGVLNFQFVENCRPVVCDGNITNIIDDHFVEPLWTKRGFY